MTAWTSHLGPIPVSGLGNRRPVWRGRRSAVLLLWVTIKPFLGSSPAWLPPQSVKLNWERRCGRGRYRGSGWRSSTIRATRRFSIGPWALPSTRPDRSELVLLHVVDTPMTRSRRPHGRPRIHGGREVPGRPGRRSSRPRLPGPAGLAPQSRSRRCPGQPPAPRPGRPPGGRFARARAGAGPALRPDRRPRPPRTGGSDAHRPTRSRPDLKRAFSGVPRAGTASARMIAGE